MEMAGRFSESASSPRRLAVRSNGDGGQMTIASSSTSTIPITSTAIATGS
jgi:hypothetical protein